MISWFQALILGLIQGLTEYLPVSSSGHLAIGQALFGLEDGESNLTFTVLVHIATIMSTVVILWSEIVWIFKDLFKWKWNEGTKYVVNILISMIPVAIVGFFFKDTIVDSLIPYANYYSDEMLRDFGDYWTETNRSLTRMRFEMQKTWNTNLRLARWARNEQSFNNFTNSHDKYKRFTSEDYIREAQLKAIKDTEEFIRQAEIRRGGVPPHLPY